MGESARPRRFVQFFLTGGWDSTLGTDPVVGEKATSGAYDPYFAQQSIRTVPGKDRLVVGGGLVTALPAFQAAPTAFVNGLWVEITAHELARQYMLTGMPSVGLNDSFPAYVASMAAASGRFPGHVVLGQIPLGDTKATAPPLQSGSITGVAGMLQQPWGQGWDWVKGSTRETSFELTRALNDLRYGTEGGKRSKVLGAWQAAEREVPKLYAGGYGPQLEAKPELFARYGGTDEGSIGGQVAACFLMLKSNITRLVSVTTGDFDTHENHDPKQINQLKQLGTALSALVADLRATPDPDLAGASLMDTTTILVTSEFVRSPEVTKGGTDHWQSASAIVMGQGVRDNTVVGATDARARALGWDGSKGVPATATSRIQPEHLAAAVLRLFGYRSQSETLSRRPLEGLFV